MAIATGGPADVPGGGLDGGVVGGVLDGGVVVAVATKTTGLPARPAAAAYSEFPPALPSVQRPTVAIPSESLFAVSPLTEPPPLRILKVTVTPGTPTPVAVVILTA